MTFQMLGQTKPCGLKQAVRPQAPLFTEIFFSNLHTKVYIRCTCVNMCVLMNVYTCRLSFHKVVLPLYMSVYVLNVWLGSFPWSAFVCMYACAYILLFVFVRLVVYVCARVFI